MNKWLDDFVAKSLHKYKSINKFNNSQLISESIKETKS